MRKRTSSPKVFMKFWSKEKKARKKWEIWTRTDLTH